MIPARPLQAQRSTVQQPEQFSVERQNTNYRFALPDEAAILISQSGRREMSAEDFRDTFVPARLPQQCPITFTKDNHRGLPEAR